MDPKEGFRALIDYFDAFEPEQRHRGMLFWNEAPSIGVGRLVDVTSHFLQAIEKGEDVLGVLPDDTANEWTLEEFETILDRFKPRFDLEDVNKRRLIYNDFDGTASVTLRHKTFPRVAFKVVAVKKAAEPKKNKTFLVDCAGRCMSTLKIRRVRVFTFEFVTNRTPLRDWAEYLQSKGRAKKKRKK